MRLVFAAEDGVVFDIGESEHMFDALLDGRVNKAYDSGAVQFALSERDGRLRPKRDSQGYPGCRTIGADFHADDSLTALLA